MSNNTNTIYVKYIKRLLDIILSLIAIIILSPLILVLCLLVKIKLGSPVIFTQERPGKDEKIFRLYKFRSMTGDRDAKGNLLPDDERLTSFGKKLRSTSLDELPELFNILNGDMSIVGPRPLLIEYLNLYNKNQKKRHNVRPGLTGYAQVNGRNSVSWEERFDMDIWYVNNISLITDIKIILNTIKVVLRKDGISSGTSVTMEKFKGTAQEVKIWKIN